MEITENKRPRLKKTVQIGLMVILVVFVVMFIESQLQNRKVGKIEINITNQNSNYFLDTLEIKRLLTDNGKDDITSAVFKNVSIKTLESRVKANLFVEKCEIARNLRGDLFVEVTQATPIARFLRQGKPDFYIDSTGKIMSVIDKYTARVILVTRNPERQLPQFKKHRHDQELLKLLTHIYKDKFWHSQITQLDINQEEEITMYLQVGNHTIDFGTCDNWEDKLKRLRIFYQEILPRKGWNTYKKVGLKYDKQIVCE
jgi:cell division protein FtsQ